MWRCWFKHKWTVWSDWFSHTAYSYPIQTRECERCHKKQARVIYG